MAVSTSVQDSGAEAFLPAPRELTAAALIRGLATAERIIGLASLLLSLGLVMEVALGPGLQGGLVTAATLVAWSLPLLLAAAIHLARPRRTSGVVFLLVGLVSTTGWSATILDRSTPGALHGAVLLEATAWTLALMGALHPTARSGVLWTVMGLATGTVGLSLGALISGARISLSVDRIVDGAIVIVAYLFVALGWSRMRGRLPALSQVERSTREAHARRLRERAAAAVVHDTLLSSLTLVARAPIGPADARLLRVIRRDLRVVDTAEVTAAGTAATSSELLPLQLLELADGFRWRGLRVDVSGVDSVPELDDGIAAALVAAVSAALENVARHSGAASAEVTIGASESAVTVMVVDTGTGFDPKAVPVERMGVRESIVGRVERLGGTVRIFSGPSGTTVVLTLPLTLPPATSPAPTTLTAPT